MSITLDQAIEQATEQLSRLVGREPSSVAGGFKDEEGWHVSVEVLERKAIPDRMDLLAMYDVLLDDEGNVVRFDRGDLRARGDAGKRSAE